MLEIALPLIAAGLSAGSQKANSDAVIRANRETMQYNLDMYNRQRADALTDWNSQNAYNSPAAMMKRYREAGLNPNLIYGNGTSTPAGTVRGASPGSYKAEAPRVDASAIIGGFANSMVQQAQVNNLKAQEQLIVQNAINKAADTNNKISQGKLNEINLSKGTSDLKRYDQLGDLSLQALEQGVFKTEAEIQKIKTDTAFTLTQQELNIAKNASDLKEAVQRIAESRKRVLLMQDQQLETRARTAKTIEERFNVIAQRSEIAHRIKNIDESTRSIEVKRKIDTEDLQLKKLGINPNDPAWERKLGQLINELF